MPQTSLAVPINLVDKEKTTEKSAAQVLTNPLNDSRLYPNYYAFSAACTRKFRKDPTVQLARWAILSQMIHTPWVYLNYKNKANQEILDFVENNFTPLRDFFLQQSVFGTLDYGWQPFEVIYKPEGGQIWIDCFKALLHEYTDILVYTNNGKFAGFVNQNFTSNAVLILNEYALNTNFEVEGTDWYGISVYLSLQKILESWDNVQETANRYDKKIAGAAWVVYYPVGENLYNGTMTDNGIIAKAILTTLEGSGGVAIPDEIQEWLDDTIDKETRGKWRIEILSADSNNQAGFVDRQKYLDILKIRAFGCTERSLLEGSAGTKEEASVHTDITLATIDSRHRLICNTLNCYTIPQLLKMNFGKKYMWSVRLMPAPLADTQYTTIKSIYHALLQNSEDLDQFVSKLNLDAIHTQLGLPTNGGSN